MFLQQYFSVSNFCFLDEAPPELITRKGIMERLFGKRNCQSFQSTAASAKQGPKPKEGQQKIGN